MIDLADIRTFPQLIKYLRDELDWPIAPESFEELTFEYTPEELGIDSGSAAKIQEIKRLRPLSVNQPWGVFFVKFEPKRLPVVALKRILNSVVLKKRASANHSERAAWDAEDLLFISNYGDGDARQITFAHFSQDPEKQDLPTLKVLGWDNLDTPLHNDHVAEELSEHLTWPKDEADIDAWREAWRSAFTLRHREVITTSRELAIRLAELARAIRDRIRTALAIETETGPLTLLLKTFREALVHDLDEDGFADMYAQTIAYGLLSARIADPTGSGSDALATQIPVTNPFLKELMNTFLQAGGRGASRGRPAIDFDELGVSEVVELLDDANMEAVILDFGDRNPEEDPVIHFYELFLKAYDAKKRLQRGVFYTPRPVVSYIVRSVDELLRTEFHLADGLADTATWGEMVDRHAGLTLPEGVTPENRFVTVLDPAVGTGTFLVEAIDVINKTLVEKWRREGHGDKRVLELWNDYVPQQLLPRLHGYELLMAPYAIAHLKIGLKLHETGYRFGSAERARVFLTNALEPPHDFSGRFDFAMPALAHEAEAVNEIKAEQAFTVVIGNPPYAKLSQNQGSWIDSLMERYKTTIKTGEIQRQALSNDYVKFVCLASTILERSGAYVLGMITDNSYLDGPLFRDMRSDLLQTYRPLHITDLGGNSRRIEATAADQNVFDIQQGVAVVLGSRIGDHASDMRLATVRGSRAEKTVWLTSNTASMSGPTELSPSPPQFYFLPPFADDASSRWESWPSLPEVFAGGIRKGRPLAFNGAALATRHDSFAVAFTSVELRDNLEVFFDTSQTRRELEDRFRLCSTSHFDFDRARSEATLQTAVAAIRPILYRPFDTRFVVYHPLLIGEPRPDVMKHLLAGSLALLSTRRVTGKPYDNVFVCRGLVEYKAATHDRNTQVFPLDLTGDDPGPLLAGLEDGRQSNLAARLFADWQSTLGVNSPEDVFHAIYAILYSPEYRRRFRHQLERDYARIPRPAAPSLNRILGKLGSDLVDLHLMQSAMLDDLPVTYMGPTKPTVQRVRWSNDTVWLDGTGSNREDSADPGTLGFRCVPLAVWNFHIGGYEVCKKWLKDRKGRTLSKDDIEHYQKIVVALSETIRIMGEIDEVIGDHGGWPDAFVG